MTQIKFTDKQLQEILEEKYGFEFGKPSYVDVPRPSSDYVGDDSLGGIDSLVSFLTEAVIIKDPFGGDHSLRRDHRSSFEKQYNCNGFLKRKNKLGANKLSTLINSPFMILDFVVKQNDSEVYNSFLDHYGSTSQIFSQDIVLELRNYQNLNFETKVGLMSQIDLEVYNFLDFFPK